MPALGGVVPGDAAEAGIAEDDPGVPVEDAEPLANGGQDAPDLLVLEADLPEHVLELARHGVEAPGQPAELAAPAGRDGDVEIARRDLRRRVDDLAKRAGHGPGQENGQDEGQERDQPDDLEQIAAQGPHERFEILHEIAQAQGALDLAVDSDGDAHVHHIGLERRAGPDRHLPLAPERGLDLRAKEMVLHVPRLFLRIGKDDPGGVDDRDPRSRPAAVRGHEAFEVPARVSRHQKGRDLALEEQGHALQVGRPLRDVVPAHRGRGEKGHRPGQEGDDGRVAQEDPQEKRLFHSSTLYPTPRMFLIREAAGPNFSLRFLMWTSTVLSTTAFSSPQRWSRIWSRVKTRPRPRRQQLQDLEFRRGQVDLRPLDGHLELVEVDDQRPQRDPPGGLSPGRPAEDGVDPGDELLDREGLGHVVIRTELEPDDLVGLVPFRGQHDDRYPGQALGPPDPPADLETVGLGQHQVEEEQGRRLVAEVLEQAVGLLEALEAVAGLLEVDLQELEDIGLVVESGDHRSHGLTSRLS